MTKVNTFEFITLTSGGTNMSSRSEVDAEIIANIRTALARDGVLWAGWSVRVLSQTPMATVFQMLLNGTPLSDCWLCIDATVSDALWEELEPQVPPSVVVHRPRGVPWLAVALVVEALPEMLARPHRLMELGDAERCVAWAFLAEKS